VRVGLFLAFLVGLPLNISTVYARIWTDKTGTHKIEAELVTVENDVVQLKKPDGTVIKVPINKLCEDDGSYARKEMASRASAVPKADSAKAAATPGSNNGNPAVKATPAGGEHANLIEDLQSGNTDRVKAAARQLSKGPRDDQAEAVSKALCGAMKVRDRWAQIFVLKALAVWDTPDAEATVIAATKQSDTFVSAAAFDALAKFKTESAVTVAAAALSNQMTRDWAANSLKAMGSVAEPQVIHQLDSQDTFLKFAVIEILSKIGGNDGLSALKAELPKATGPEKNQVEIAIAKIEARLAGNPAAADEKIQAIRGKAIEAELASHAARDSSRPGGGFFWILKLIIVAVSIACFIIGPLAVYMGFKALKSVTSAGFGQTTAAIRAFVCGPCCSF
jgi:hypothetical protein